MTIKIGPKSPELAPQPQPPAPPPPPPPPPVERKPAPRSQFDSTRVTAQRQQALQTIGANEASTLRTEVLGDGRANCLERAARLAGPGDSLVLMKDRSDGVGHALVRHPDGSVVDPNYPTVRYETLGQWQALNPRYGSPVTVDARQARQALSVPPGPQRDAMLARLGLMDEASVRVADGGTEATGKDKGVQLSAGVSIGADGKITYTQETKLEPTEFEFKRGELGATLHSGPYANAEVELEWDPNHPTANGTYEVTATYSTEAGAMINAGLTYGPYGVSGGIASGLSGSQEYKLFLSPEQMAQMAAGTYPLPSIADPMSLPVGGAMTLDAGAFRTTTGSLTYGALTLSSEATQTNAYSVAMERTGDNTVRVTVGPKDTLESSFEVGLSLGEHASLTMTRDRTYTNENLVSAEFDLSTPQGQAAYETFLSTGALPAAEGPGVSGLYHEQNYTYEGALAAGLELGPFSLGGELWSENSVITRRMEDGVETLTTQDTLPNGTTISGSFIPSPDGNHGFGSVSFTVNDPSRSTPVTVTITGEEGFQSLRQAAAEQMRFAMIATLAGEKGLSQSEALTWMQNQGGPYATIAQSPTDPNFSYEAFSQAFNDAAQNGWSTPTMPPMTQSLLEWTPGKPYLTIFTNNLRGSTVVDDILGSSGVLQEPPPAGIVPAPSLLDMNFQDRPGIDVTGA